MSYAFDFPGNGVFTPDGRAEISPAAVDAHNAAIERAELARWAAKPAQFSAYVTDKGVTTWRGAPLGRVVARTSYRNNFGARIECLTVQATNGARYHGRYGADWSQLINLRKSGK